MKIRVSVNGQPRVLMLRGVAWVEVTILDDSNHIISSTEYHDPSLKESIERNVDDEYRAKCPHCYEKTGLWIVGSGETEGYDVIKWHELKCYHCKKTWRYYSGDDPDEAVIGPK